MLSTVFEQDGSDLTVLPYAPDRTEGALRLIARQLAALQGIQSSDVSLRFAEHAEDASPPFLPEGITANELGRDDPLVHLAFEHNGVDVQILPYVAFRTEGDLLTIVQQLADARAAPLSDVSLRFVDAFDELLCRFPPEDLLEEDDPAYPDAEAGGGCRTCASGKPCRERIRTDVADILREVNLPDDTRLACLAWMIQEECSSLTHSNEQMAEVFQACWQRENTKTIAAQNDAFRSAIGTGRQPSIDGREIPGMVVATQGIQAMSLADQAQILAQVRDFDAWTTENNPHGEHDYGSFTYKGERILFKIDYYDPELTYGSENPADLAQTMRVLTIMTALEY